MHVSIPVMIRVQSEIQGLRCLCSEHPIVQVITIQNAKLNVKLQVGVTIYNPG